MALTDLTPKVQGPTKEINYLSKTFDQYKQNLINYAKVYFPDSYNDFNESSPGSLFIDMAAYVGDVLGYYLDTQFRENLIWYAQEQDNIIAIAQSLGYRVKPATASTGFAQVYQLCPARDISQNYIPDDRYFLRLNVGAIFRSPDFGNTAFRTIQIVDFSDPSDREISVYATDINDRPITYLIKKTVQIVSGEIKTYNVSFGSPQKFSKVTLSDDDVLEIIKVTDDNGFVWSQVDYLAQDLVFDDKFVTSPYTGSDESLNPTYALKLKRTPRRFVVRYNEDFKCELQFGSGVLNDFDPLVILDPKKVANSEYQLNLASTSLDPSDFLSSNSYGLAPSNITMTIRYTVGGGLQSNAPSNSITSIDTVQVMNDSTGFTPAELALYNNIVASLAVNNEEPATGGKGQDSVEEIRQAAMAFFNAQNRLVTPEDYLVRCYAMPPKYGGVAKAFVVRDEQINDVLRITNSQAPSGGQFVEDAVSPHIVNLYVLGYNKDKKLSTLNRNTKANLKQYLETYRVLTDEIRILDGFVINIGVNFRIIVFKNFNMNEVLARCISSLKSYFDIDKWQMNQPIVISDLYTVIGSIEGVQSVVSVKIFNRYAFRDSSDYNDYIYDIDAATINGIVYPSLDSSIFELRYPEKDIIGSAQQ